MAIIITDECINCGACEPECPNTAIYEGGVEWTWSGGTKLTEVELEDGTVIGGKDPMNPVSDEFYYIVSDKCTECHGFHEDTARIGEGGSARMTQHRDQRQWPHGGPFRAGGGRTGGPGRMGRRIAHGQVMHRPITFVTRWPAGKFRLRPGDEVTGYIACKA